MRSSLHSHIPVILALIGCSGCAGSMAGDSIAPATSALPPSAGLLESPALLEVFDLQVAGEEARRGQRPGAVDGAGRQH